MYEYNALGQRIKKSTSTGNTYFHYGQNGELLYEIDSLGKNKHYVYLNGMLIARVDNDVPYYYHTDHLGTPQAMTNAAQAIVWNAKYEPFGKVLIKTQTIVNNVRLLGQYADQETGLHYNYYRSTYDPGTGRYGEVDPIGMRGGLNLYAYVDGNPLSYVDPLGLSALGTVGGFVGTWGGRAIGGAVGTFGGPVGTFLGGAAGGTIGNKFGTAVGDAIDNLCKDGDDECEKEWREARRTCRELIYEQMEQAAGRRKKRSVTGVTGGYTDVEECARGLVSKRCGGNELR